MMYLGHTPYGVCGLKLQDKNLSIAERGLSHSVWSVWVEIISKKDKRNSFCHTPYGVCGLKSYASYEKWTD